MNVTRGREQQDGDKGDLESEQISHDAPPLRHIAARAARRGADVREAPAHRGLRPAGRGRLGERRPPPPADTGSTAYRRRLRCAGASVRACRSDEHTTELQSLMRTAYA